MDRDLGNLRLLPLVCVWLSCGVPGGKEAQGHRENSRSTVVMGQHLAPQVDAPPTVASSAPAGRVSTIPEGHQLHTATLLPSGKVLIAGGMEKNAEEFDPATGTWSSTGSMIIARLAATATLLPSGKVLVAGGFTTYSTESAELYDPLTRTWRLTGAMKRRSDWHTATLLPSGKVLVVSSNHAEEYDPATETWNETEALGATVAQGFHTATLLPSGKVLVTGGGPDSAAEYDPLTRTWGLTGMMTQGHSYHTTTRLPSGKVLLVDSNGAEEYDPDTRTWSETSAPSTAHATHTATLLPSGNVLIAGGNTDSVETYNPATRTWSTAAAMTESRALHTATLLPSGNVLMVDGGKAEVYTPPDSSSWSTAGGTLLPRHGHTATLLPSGKVLVAGGEETDSAEIYDPATGTWSLTGALPNAHSQHTATLLPSGKVLVAGGRAAGTLLAHTTELYDPITGTWSTTGALPTARYDHTATLLPSGKVLVAGGLADGILASAEVYDPTTGTWSDAGAMATARYGHTATLLPSGRVLVTGGYGGGNLAGTEEYDPDTGTWSDTGAIAHARSGHTATLLPSGQVLIAGGGAGAEEYDSATGIWNPASWMPRERALHTATLLPSGQVLLVGGSVYRPQSIPDILNTALYTYATGIEEWRPAVDALAVKKPGATFRLTGRGFRGLSDASGGTTRGSATDFPLVSLMAMEEAALLRLPGRDFSDTAVTVTVPMVKDGDYLLSVMTNGITGGQVLRVDGTAPTAPHVTAPGSGALLDTSRPIFSGTAEPGSTVRLFLAGVEARPVTADAAGAWSYTPDTALTEGSQGVSATATDEAGNESPASAALGFTVDTLAPGAPEVTEPAGGASFYDKRMLDIVGTAEPASTVRLWLDDAEPVTLKADGSGVWRFTPPQPLELGHHALSATATDEAGNTSAPASSSFTLAIPTSYYGWSCTTSPGLPLLWAWLLLAFWLRTSSRRT